MIESIEREKRADVWGNQFKIDSPKTDINKNKNLKKKKIVNNQKIPIKFLINCKDDPELQPELISLLEKLNNKKRGSEITIKDVAKYLTEVIKNEDIEKLKKRSWSYDDWLDCWYDKFIQDFKSSYEGEACLTRSGWLVAIVKGVGVTVWRKVILVGKVAQTFKVRAKKGMKVFIEGMERLVSFVNEEGRQIEYFEFRGECAVIKVN